MLFYGLTKLMMLKFDVTYLGTIEAMGCSWRNSHCRLLGFWNKATLSLENYSFPFGKTSELLSGLGG